ncbi:MAG: DNA replication protein, partial [Alkalibacterium sp.]|nr:DNA replication protein [Alkalibacterium sp.]
LYFHLNMSADDDGFIGNAKTIRRMIGASEDDFKLLMAKEFIIPFESGVVVIKDWKVHNYIRSDRYNATVYTEEKKQLSENENGQYQLGMTNGIPVVDQMDTQVRLGKDRLGKDSKTDEPKENKPSSAELTEWFEKVWSYYPRKEGKSKSKSVFMKEVKAAENPEEMYRKIGKGVYNYAEMMKAEERDRTKIKMGSVFFNNKSWEDEDIMNYHKPKKKVENKLSMEEALRQEGGL